MWRGLKHLPVALPLGVVVRGTTGPDKEGIETAVGGTGVRPPRGATRQAPSTRGLKLDGPAAAVYAAGAVLHRQAPSTRGLKPIADAEQVGVVADMARQAPS